MEHTIQTDTDPVFIMDPLLVWKHGNSLYFLSFLLLMGITLSALPLGDIGRFRWGIVAVCIALLPVAGEILTPVIFPWLMKWLITLPLILHMAGGLYGFYFTGYPVYDKVCHLAASVAIAFIIFETILVLSYVFDWKPSRATILATIFSMSIFFAFAWEYAEYNLDAFSGSTFFLGFEDSAWDMVFNTIGTGFVLYWISRYMEREPFDQMIRRFFMKRKTS